MNESASRPEWRRSRACSSGACVEVAKVEDQYLIRDSKNLDTVPLVFSAGEWNAFVSGVKRDEFGFE